MSHWIYVNNIHQYVKVHRSTCPCCNDGRGTHGASNSYRGRWEPAAMFNDARAAAETTGYDVSACAVCLPT